MDKIEIIGINNFIGFHLTKFCLEQGIEVVGYELPLEDDSYHYKKLELGRSANLTIRNLNDASWNQKIVIDLYGVENKTKYINMFKDGLIKSEHCILVNEETAIEESVQLILLPVVFGPWDYIEEDELTEDSTALAVTDVCMFLEGKLSKNEPINFTELQPKNFKNDYLERKNWIERYKKSK